MTLNENIKKETRNKQKPTTYDQPPYLKYLKCGATCPKNYINLYLYLWNSYRILFLYAGRIKSITTCDKTSGS